MWLHAAKVRKICQAYHKIEAKSEVWGIRRGEFKTMVVASKCRNLRCAATGVARLAIVSVEETVRFRAKVVAEIRDVLSRF